MLARKTVFCLYKDYKRLLEEAVHNEIKKKSKLNKKYENI